MALELFVAWRHLRDPERRVPRTLVAGLILVALAVLAWLVGGKLAGTGQPYDIFSRSPYYRFAAPLRVGAVVAGVVGSACLWLGILFRLFTAFTAFAIFGVFIGTYAPIVTLSVMSGFEADLKTKIRGAKADVVIEASGVNGERPFTEWKDVETKLRALPGVVAATPYLETEVMVRSGATPAGIVLRGIDPASAASVLDVGRTVRDGRLDMLAKPELVKTPGWKKDPPSGQAPDDTDDLPPRGVPEKTRVARAGDTKKPNAADKPEAATGATPPATVLPTIFLGEELYARMLRVFVGDEVDIVCPLCGNGPAGPMPKLRRFRVAGHFYSGMYEFDSKLAYISLSEAQRFLGQPGEVSGIDLRTITPEAARGVADAARALLGPRYDVRAWEDLNRALFLALEIEKIAMFLAFALIALVASFSIISNLFMLVTQKGREVAILKTMGARDQSILRIFLAEGMYIGLVGLVPGVSLGVGVCMLLERYGLRLPSDVYYIERLPVVMRPFEIATIAAVALVMSGLATLVPAVIASRLRPVDGLRYE